MKNKKKKDFLSNKLTELAHYEASVRSTIQTLETLSEAMNAAIEEIEGYQRALEVVKSQVKLERDRANKVVQSFEMENEYEEHSNET